MSRTRTNTYNERKLYAKNLKTLDKELDLDFDILTYEIDKYRKENRSD